MSDPHDPKRPPSRLQAPDCEPDSVQAGELSTRPPASGIVSPFHANGASDFPFLAPPQAPDEIGRLGHYRVLGVLGRGGMGVVFRAEDTGLERPVALKVILPQFAGNADDRARFQREARAQAKVEHDHVAAIYQVSEDRGVLFLAMPLLNGRTLADELREHPRPALAELLRIGREAAEGLAAAHDKGLVHRDVKPANLWLEGSRRRVKVLDFGLARTMAGPAAAGDPTLTRTGALLGTPAYMSLEQALGQKVDARTDIFSLGVILYEMATGVRPYQGDSFGALAVALATDTPQPVSLRAPEVPAVFSQFVQQLLSSNVEDRPESMQAVIDEIRRIEHPTSGKALAAGLLETAGPALRTSLSEPVSSAWKASHQPRERRSWRVPALAALGLVIAVAVAVILAWPPKAKDLAENNTPVPTPTPAETPSSTPPTTPVKPSPTPVVSPNSSSTTLPTPSPSAATGQTPKKASPAPPVPPVASKKTPVTPESQAEFEKGLDALLGRDGPKDLDQAAARLRSAAEANNPEGGFFAGWVYNHGLGKPAHFAVATYWYQQAAAEGQPLARAVLALAQLDAWDLGNMVDVDLAKGRDTLGQVAGEVKKRAKDGCPIAQVILAEMYAGGHGVAKSPTQAFAMYEAAANSAYAPAQYAVGAAFDTDANRFDRKPDTTTALEWYKLAAGQNDPPALYLLGEAARTGRFGEKNPQEAVKNYRKAVDLGDEDAMKALARAYAEGSGVDRDEAEAAYWQRKAADNYQQDADGGSVIAMRKLADAYRDGVGRPTDKAQAQRHYDQVEVWMRKKSDAGSPAAIYALGVDLTIGRLGKTDEKNGLSLIQKAAELGLPVAMNRLGEMYEKAEGVEKDEKKAIVWYRKASAAGSKEADASLKRLKA